MNGPGRDGQTRGSAVGRRALMALPLGAALLAGAGLWGVLRRMRQGVFDPHEVPSPLVGHRPPGFDLPGLAGFQGFSSDDLAAQKRPLLVNFFASWCAPCAIEHPELMALAGSGLPIWGIVYKDRPADAAAFIARRGNPFARLAADAPGRVAIDWGVYGVPESYLLDAAGIVRWRIAGPITAEVARSQLRPLLAGLS